jgi:arylformamidase
MLWDISPALAPGTPAFPGDTPYSEALTATIGPDCPVNVGAITLSTHAGSHADAPLHYDADGAPAGDFDLDRFIGPARVVDLRDVGPMIRPEHLTAALATPIRRLLLRTYERMPQDRWEPDFTAIDPAAIDLLAARGVDLVGTDAASIDPAASKTLDAHMAVRRHGMLIIENLVLDAVPAGDYELVALPLKLVTMDAAPLRAVLRPLPKSPT